jgi:lipopolysaccharide/colanic/teichoic acid biosynthesis glycosyltransferase
MAKCSTTRCFDIAFSSIAIIALIPVWVFVVPILRLTGEGEVFYPQARVGKDGTIFKILKFATMLKESPSLPGGEVTTEGDPRVLPFGRLLRKSKINELPQLINIFFGHMSLVGPRPLTPKQQTHFTSEQKVAIYSMTPGLTGVGSLVFRNEESIMARTGIEYTKVHNEIITPYKGELETWYKRNRSLRLYFTLIIFTAWSVFKPRATFRDKFRDLPSPPRDLEGLI